MLSDLSKQVRECYRCAENCAQQAAAQTDAKLKEDFLYMERRWLLLAHSYEFNKRLGGFSDELERQADKLPKPR
jgi:hypothetical protein